jgi:Rod binding domain-containing protein
VSTSALTTQIATSSMAPSNDPARSSSPEVAKLRKAAGEFESMLFQSLWKSMKDTFSNQDDETDPTLESFDDWGMQALSNAVGNSGGLGIKNMILKHLEPTLSAANPGVPEGE